MVPGTCVMSHGIAWTCHLTFLKVWTLYWFPVRTYRVYNRTTLPQRSAFWSLASCPLVVVDITPLQDYLCTNMIRELFFDNISFSEKGSYFHHSMLATIIIFHLFTGVGSRLIAKHARCYEPRHEKTSLWGLRPGKTQTGLLSHRHLLESWNFVYTCSKWRYYIIQAANKKGANQTRRLICTFVVRIWHK